MLVVSDATPLNILIRTDLVFVLPELYGLVAIPPAVAAELSHPHTPEIVRNWMAARPAWLSVRSPSTIATPVGPDAGEQEAIALARELKADLLLVDDKVARREASRSGIPITGTIGVLELAAARRFLTLKDALEKLHKTDFFISAHVIRRAIERDAMRNQPPTMLTIALVILHADPARGGAERYTADLAAALAARKHRVSILAKDFGPPIAGVEFVPIAGRRISRTAEYVRFLDSLDAHLAEHSYDIVHAMLPVRRCDAYHPHAGLAADTIAAKWSNRFHPKRRMFADVERKLLNSRRPPVVLCLSDYVKQTIRRHYQLRGERLATLFNAVDLKRFDPDLPRDRASLKIQADRVVALMVAQDFDRKGVAQTIQALANIKDRRLLLVVVGKDRPSKYEKLAASLGIAEQIRFAGPVDDPRPFYRAADFFVLPTRHDPCSLAVLEALAMGLPVISTVFNGACQIMQDGRHGFILPDPQDVEALSAAMSKLLDPKARSAMRAACLELRPKLSFDGHVDRLLQIYNSAAQKSAAR